MKIGIMGAMNEEIALLKQDIQKPLTKVIADREYCSGNLYGIDTVVVFSRWGKVASASTATTLLNTFNADLIVFTGVAGAVHPELNVGDVVIADKLFQHDMDASPIFPKCVIPLLGNKYFHVAENFVTSAQNAAHKFLAKELLKTLTQETLAEFFISAPKIITGAIASGDQFVSDRKKADELLRECPETKAVEMEGAAVAQLCHEHKKPFIVFRTISDKADHSAAIDFQKFIVEVANHYSRGFIKMLYQELQRE